ncbi:hypothetical protein [Sphingomonas baiyangensis]|uniref:Permease n=1 Tax=Sphingomonas baiyangensis TaxID=2572576 RepID=A0A4U1L7Q6_9SPHN|nr:hypothetical protein [Sphingomonas baiyangensis]TKD52992.1 hypothetical protein FBR43_01195 [Sphingomonas baiyangensis]
MDFMKWLNSLDELLYEVMSWLLFFPITLWRAAVRPLTLMDEVDRQQALPEDQQYASLLSPPLFLALALLLAHATAMALGQTDAIIANTDGLASLINDTTTALVLRVVVFASFALCLAARLVRSRRAPLSRLRLRLPFYEQCYPVAIFALGLSLGTSFAGMADTATHMLGMALIALSVLYFSVTETRWFADRRGVGYPRAIGNVAWAIVEALLLMIAIGFLFTR